MKIHSNLKGFKAVKPVVTIGMFDGLHTGHRDLIKQTISSAKKINGESVVLTFWPHPRVVLKKDEQSLRFLTSLEEKTVMLGRMGVDHIVIVPFNLNLAQLTASEFTRQILVDKIGIEHLIVGFNHRFGSDGYKGGVDYGKMGDEFGFEVSIIDPVLVGEEKSSSTAIRNLLLKGEVSLANRLLGYPYRITGRVVGGNRLGRAINYPTANVEVEESAKLIPIDGVYACRVKVLGKKYNGMLNIGFRPTVSTQKDHRTIEVHILDFSENIYSEEIIVEFIDRIRDEIKFTDVEELKRQLLIDELNVRAMLNI